MCERVIVRGEGVRSGGVRSEGVRGENDNGHGHVVTTCTVVVGISCHTVITELGRGGGGGGREGGRESECVCERERVNERVSE